MPASPHHSLIPSSLAGARIWLSGSIPDAGDMTETQRDAIAGFVRQFTRLIFERGGHIVHGSHPSITPILLDEARKYQVQGGSRDRLMLAVSRYFSKNPDNAPVDKWRKLALVDEIPEANGDQPLAQSLELLRKWMAYRCDAIVVVGGKWWQSNAGVPSELHLAIERGIPCFLLGGLGGAAQDFLNKHLHVFSLLKNGFDEAENKEISTSDNIGDLANKVCSQLERLPLVRGRGTDGISFRILALDGGGIKGSFTAAAIASWEKQTGLRVVDHFDLIAGTSTGGILALGLGLGLSGQEMLDFYQQRGPVIFPITRIRGRICHTLRHIVWPKYSQEVLHRELQDAFYKNKGGNPVKLRDSLCRLVIPTYHAVAGASHQFRTPHHCDLTADADTNAADAALATAAAPTFFSAAKIANMVAESRYFDGGVWANSPAMAAIIEAVCFLRIPLERIDVLSVGTTEEPFTARGQARPGLCGLKLRAGIIGWLWKGKIIDLLMNVQQESSLRLARNLVGEPKFLRVNTVTVPGSYSLDGSKEIGELADLGNRAALEPAVLGQVKSRFLNGVSVTPWEKY